ncbi:MAG: hypothetical protein ACR2FI_09240 [Burkholderiales bacterium]|nr:hypothetical protein [Burkholderiales bacterium]MDQ3195899.1 hypothetical protein [Pseudomonadota bacterium]
MRHESSEQLPLVQKLLERKEELEQALKRSPARQTQQNAANASKPEEDATTRHALMSV